MAPPTFYLHPFCREGIKGLRMERAKEKHPEGCLVFSRVWVSCTTPCAVCCSPRPVQSPSGRYAVPQILIYQTRERTGCLHLSDFRLHRFGTHIMCLVLVFRLYLLCYAVEFFIAFLLVIFFLFFFIHFITSGIVWANQHELFFSLKKGSAIASHSSGR